MAVNTSNTTLKSASTKSGAYTSVCPITNYPDMGSAPSKIDTTDLTATKYKTNIFGLAEAPELTFEANYDETLFNTINGMTGKQYFQVAFDTSDGKFTWYGSIKVFANGGGVDEIRKMTVVTSLEYVSDIPDGIEFTTT